MIIVCDNTIHFKFFINYFVRK